MKLLHVPCLFLLFATLATQTPSLSFGRHYAVLNLDLINILIGSVDSTPQGEAFVANTATWINAVHAQSPPPLSIFTRVYFSNPGNPELGPTTPFGQIVAALLPLQETTPATSIYSAFQVLGNDTVLQKTRYYAGAGNALEEILRAQQIDTVIISGIRSSGVVLDTVFHLYDLDYNIYVISNNTIETPVVANDPVQAAIVGAGGIISKLGAMVITLEEALGALTLSGPAIY